MTTPLNNGSSYMPTAGEGTVPLWPGVYAGTVTNNADPLGVGRLQMNVPQVLGPSVSAWAIPLGTYYTIPNNGTTVSCSFIGGDPSQPAWIGPLDLAPAVEAAAPPTVTYSASQPSDPRVGDIWYPILGGASTGPPEVWTFNSGTSTFSWVVQPSIGNTAIAAGAVSLAKLDGTVTSRALNGITTTIGTTAPTSGMLTGDIFINDTTGQVFQYSSGTWNAITINAGTVIQAGTIVGNQIVAGASIAAPLITGGTISGATFNGTNWIENAQGSFLYSGTPALGNLIASITPATVRSTDGFGNVYYPGNCVYNPSGGAVAAFATQMYAGQISMGTDAALNPLGGDQPAEINLFSGDRGVSILSGNPNGENPATIGLSASSGGGANSATISCSSPLVLGSGTAPNSIYGNQNGTPTAETIEGFAGGVVLSKAIQGGNTNSTTSSNAMFTPFPIPASDAAQNTAYRITCGGHGTQATGTAVALNFQLFAFSVVMGASVDTGGIAAGAVFHWNFDGTLIIGALGGSPAGTVTPWSFQGKMIMSQATASAGGHPTAMDQQGTAGSNPINTTVASNITLQAGWASTTGSPTIVCTGAIIERIGA